MFFVLIGFHCSVLEGAPAHTRRSRRKTESDHFLFFVTGRIFRGNDRPIFGKIRRIFIFEKSLNILCNESREVLYNCRKLVNLAAISRRLPEILRCFAQTLSSLAKGTGGRWPSTHQVAEMGADAARLERADEAALGPVYTLKVALDLGDHEVLGCKYGVHVFFVSVHVLAKIRRN